MTRIVRRVRWGTSSQVAAAVLMLGALAPIAVRADGDVTATVSGGTLTIKGDDAANGIHISPLGAGSYAIDPDGTTTVNGAAAIFNANGVTGDVKITLNDGDDELFVEDTNSQPFPDDIVIRTGKGNDTVDLNDFGVTDDLKVSTDDGDDTISLSPGIIGGNLTLKTGSGSDGMVVESGTVSGRTTVSTGGDPDSVFFDFSQTFVGGVTVRAGGGDDTVSVVSTTTQGNLKISCGSGTDTAGVSDPGNSFATPPTLAGCENTP